MAQSIALLIVVVLAGVASAGNAAIQQGNPMVDVVAMLDDLLKAIKDEGKEEVKTYGEFSTFCEDSSKQLSEAVQKGQDTIGGLSADIEALTAEKAETQKKLDQRTAESQKKMSELGASVTECSKGKLAFQATSADLTKAIAQMDAAIKAIKDAKPSLVASARQVVRRSLELAYALDVADRDRRPRRAIATLLGERSAITAFLQDDLVQQPGPTLVVAAAPGAAPSPAQANPEYKSSTGNVVEVIENLKQDFSAQLAKAEDASKASEKAFAEVQTSLGDAIGKIREAIDKAKEKVESLKGGIASKHEELEEAQITLKEDTRTLDALKKKCLNAAKTFDQRSSLRGREVEAIEKAQAILKEEVKGKYDETVGSLLQRSARPQAPKPAKVSEAETGAAPLGFLQVLSPKKRVPSLVQEVQGGGAAIALLIRRARLERKKRQVIELLTAGSEKIRSPALAALALRINAQKEEAAEPRQFKKVKALILDLIHRIYQEMRQDRSKQGWCNGAVGVAVNEREARSVDGQQMSAELTKLEGKKAELLEELEELGKSRKELAASLAEAAKLRAEEKATTREKLATAKGGRAALERAIDVLKTFYMSAKHEKYVALAQGGKEPEPGFELEAAYDVKSTNGESVVGLLEEVEVDFEKAITDMEKQEAVTAAEFVEFERATKAAQSGKHTKVSLCRQDLEATEHGLNQTVQDLKTNQKLIDAASKELEELKTACDNVGMNHAERIAQRQGEIDLLKKCSCLFGGTAAECDPEQ